jgi:hypothetical protein
MGSCSQVVVARVMLRMKLNGVKQLLEVGWEDLSRTLSAKEVAEIWGVSEARVVRMCETREIPGWWDGDTWHTSRSYVTASAGGTLVEYGALPLLQKAVRLFEMSGDSDSAARLRYGWVDTLKQALAYTKEVHRTMLGLWAMDEDEEEGGEA